jgi:hypothetical protein
LRSEPSETPGEKIQLLGNRGFRGFRMSGTKIDIRIGRALVSLAPNQLRAKYLQILLKKETGDSIDVEDIVLERESDGYMDFAEGKEGLFKEAAESKYQTWNLKNLNSYEKTGKT